MRLDEPQRSIAAVYRSGVNVAPASAAYPPYEPPKIAIRLGSAIFWSIAH